MMLEFNLLSDVREEKSLSNLMIRAPILCVSNENKEKYIDVFANADVVFLT